MIEASSAALVVEHGGNPQVDDAAHGTHEVDDRVCGRAQRLGRAVGHKRHGRAAVGAHCNKHKEQNANERGEKGTRAVRIVRVVDDGQEDHAHHGKRRTHEDEGHATAQTTVAAVRERAKERQEEESKDVVGSHDHAREGLV